MSTPEESGSQPLTRRQLREMRNTASTPVITPEEATAAKEAAEAAEAAEPIVAPAPPAAQPVVVDEPPVAADVDLAAPALTRRSARRQERLRTGSVPVQDDGAHDQPADAHEPADAPVDSSATGADEAQATPESLVHEAAAAQAADDLAAAQSEAPDVEIPSSDDEVAAPNETAQRTESVEAEADESERPQVASTFGSGLLAGEGVELELPASFDQLLTRGSAATGAIAASNALILSQTPETGSFSSPVTATGEVLITGTFVLPESLGSAGTTAGSSDGKEIDAVLVDGELPASSSPTPIAASSAISTIKSADDIIKPPAPEKGGRLMLVLVITAGALALALTGALVAALVTGVFR
ncbi:hypothetical protein [Microbacterium dextranolyticum]|uniref:Uncharacterized protein n=1 Tax=Microbacterium dextranolyticum TaxID=36806 RepID=A0A9W6HNI9_9MICO|nr:hypothetical protein [Microbacterium dextranolyticum]MBM7462875.1 hypothetical protein [Microbacterium dextranolyticum]GLJ96019.1 hypothetical protein GCM10017591_20820 [Microbacterium dextranolyticum]